MSKDTLPSGRGRDTSSLIGNGREIGEACFVLGVLEGGPGAGFADSMFSK